MLVAYRTRGFRTLIFRLTRLIASWWWFVGHQRLFPWLWWTRELEAVGFAIRNTLKHIDLRVQRAWNLSGGANDRAGVYHGLRRRVIVSCWRSIATCNLRAEQAQAGGKG